MGHTVYDVTITIETPNLDALAEFMNFVVPNSAIKVALHTAVVHVQVCADSYRDVFDFIDHVAKYGTIRKLTVTPLS